MYIVCNVKQSSFRSYILNVPFNNDDETGIVYAWIGSKADTEEARLIEEIAEEMFNNVCRIALLVDACLSDSRWYS